FVGRGAPRPLGGAGRPPKVRPASSLIACKHPVISRHPGVLSAPRLITVPLMSRERTDAQANGQAAAQRSQPRLRVAVIDRDPGFMQVLANRLGALGC